jgi:hypothetical protein
MNAHTTAFAPRLAAAMIAIGVTAALFSAVISPAMQQQVDGSVRLAHAAVSARHAAAPMLVAQADVPSAR